MKIEFSRKSFLDAFKDAKAIAPTKSPKPILKNIKLVSGESGTTLIATDLEVCIERKVENVTPFEAGTVILPTDAFSKVLASGNDELLEIISDEDHNLTVWFGPRSSVKLVSDDPDLFPVLPADAKAVRYVVSSSDLAKAIKRTIFAVEEESTRYALGGVLFEPGEGVMNLIATNGRHLAKQTIHCEREGEPIKDAGHFVVPPKALKLLIKEGPASTVAVDFIGKSSGIAFHADNSTIHSRLIEGRFPRYQDVFPASPAAMVEIVAGDLLNAVLKASVVTNDTTDGIDFQFADGKMTLTSETSDLGKATVETETSELASPIEVTLAGTYLLEMLKSIDEKTPLKIELIDGKSAVVLKTEDGYSYVIMPLTRDR